MAVPAAGAEQTATRHCLDTQFRENKESIMTQPLFIPSQRKPDTSTVSKETSSTTTSTPNQTLFSTGMTTNLGVTSKQNTTTNITATAKVYTLTNSASSNATNKSKANASTITNSKASPNQLVSANGLPHSNVRGGEKTCERVRAENHKRKREDNGGDDQHKKRPKDDTDERKREKLDETVNHSNGSTTSGSLSGAVTPSSTENTKGDGTNKAETPIKFPEGLKSLTSLFLSFQVNEDVSEPTTNKLLNYTFVKNRFAPEEFEKLTEELREEKGRQQKERQRQRQRRYRERLKARREREYAQEEWIQRAIQEQQSMQQFVEISLDNGLEPHPTHNYLQAVHSKELPTTHHYSHPPTRPQYPPIDHPPSDFSPTRSHPPTRLHPHSEILPNEYQPHHTQPRPHLSLSGSYPPHRPQYSQLYSPPQPQYPRGRSPSPPLAETYSNTLRSNYSYTTQHPPRPSLSELSPTRSQHPIPHTAQQIPSQRPYPTSQPTNNHHLMGRHFSQNNSPHVQIQSDYLLETSSPSSRYSFDRQPQTTQSDHHSAPSRYPIQAHAYSDPQTWNPNSTSPYPPSNSEPHFSQHYRQGTHAQAYEDSTLNLEQSYRNPYSSTQPPRALPRTQPQPPYQHPPAGHSHSATEKTTPVRAEYYSQSLALLGDSERGQGGYFDSENAHLYHNMEMQQHFSPEGEPKLKGMRELLQDLSKHKPTKR